MKKTKLVSIFLVIIMSLSLAAPVFATEARASLQIKSYSMEAVASVGGSLNVLFTVRGTGIMDKIGCESIYVYNVKTGELIGSCFEDDANMSNTNTGSYQNTITFDSEVGVRYEIIVTIFSENSAGRDTRQDVFYVTGK